MSRQDEQYRFEILSLYTCILRWACMSNPHMASPAIYASNYLSILCIVCHSINVAPHQLSFLGTTRVCAMKQDKLQQQQRCAETAKTGHDNQHLLNVLLNRSKTIYSTWGSTQCARDYYVVKYAKNIYITVSRELWSCVFLISLTLLLSITKRPITWQQCKTPHIERQKSWSKQKNGCRKDSHTMSCVHLVWSIA